MTESNVSVWIVDEEFTLAELQNLIDRARAIGMTMSTPVTIEATSEDRLLDTERYPLSFRISTSTSYRPKATT